MKPIFTSRWKCRLRVGALWTALATAGCAPQASLNELRDMHAAEDMKVCRSRAPTLNRPLTLEQALDYAARHNVDAWIAAQEIEFQRELATQSTLKMLPSLKLGAAHQERSRFDASSSQSLETGNQSLEPSFSSEKRSDTFDISATWNLLDFGISFLRARQQGNRISISLQRERRIRQNLAFQVVRAYWRAAAAGEVSDKTEFIEAQISTMLEKTHAEVADKTISQIEALKRETSFLQRQDEFRRYKREHMKAKAGLAKLIGLPPGTGFVMAKVDFSRSMNLFVYDTFELQREALRSRSELFEKDLEQVISRDEERLAIAQMMPGATLFWRSSYDSNRFLAFSHWNTIGLNASWDLLAIPHQIKQLDASRLQTRLLAKRRLAISVAIQTQLHLSLIDYEQAWEQGELGRILSEKHEELLRAIESQADEGKSHAGQVLDQQMKSLKARARHLTAYANVMTARARVLNTIGRSQKRNEPRLIDPSVGGLANPGMPFYCSASEMDTGFGGRFKHGLPILNPERHEQLSHGRQPGHETAMVHEGD